MSSIFSQFISRSPIRAVASAAALVLTLALAPAAHAEDAAASADQNKVEYSTPSALAS